MTEATPTDSNSGNQPENIKSDPTPSAQTPPAEEAKFTQSDIDRIITERLAKEKAISEKRLKEEREAQAEAERISKLQGEEKLKAEYEAKIKKNLEREAELTARIIRSDAISEIAKLGYAGADDLADILVRGDAETTTKAIQAFDKTVRAEAQKLISGSIAKGGPAGVPVTNPADADLRKRFGL